MRRKIDTIFPLFITFVHQNFRRRRKIVIISPLEIVFVFNFGRLQRIKKYHFLREREDNFAPQAIFLEKKCECQRENTVTIFPEAKNFEYF